MKPKSARHREIQLRRRKWSLDRRKRFKSLVLRTQRHWRWCIGVSIPGRSVLSSGSWFISHTLNTTSKWVRHCSNRYTPAVCRIKWKINELLICLTCFVFFCRKHTPLKYDLLHLMKRRLCFIITIFLYTPYVCLRLSRRRKHLIQFY